MGLDKVKEKPFEFYLNGKEKWVRFKYNNKDYDMSVNMAENLMLGAGFFLVFLMLLNAIVED